MIACIGMHTFGRVMSPILNEQMIACMGKTNVFQKYASPCIQSSVSLEGAQ